MKQAIRRFRSTRRLAAVAVVSAAAVLGGGYAYGAMTDTAGNVYTACLANGSIQYAAIGAVPQKKCTSPSVQISWSQTGPQGLQGLKGDTGATGAPGSPGTAGTAGAAGVSPTVASLPVGDQHCPAGGAAITDATNSTAYVCSGANGTDGQAGKDGAPFSGTFTSGDYSLAVAATGITLQGPGIDKISLTGTGVTMRSVEPIDVRGSGNVAVQAGQNLTFRGSAEVEVQAGTNLNLSGAGELNAHAAGALDVKGSEVDINAGAVCNLAARLGDPVASGAIVGGASTVCIGG